MGCFELSYRSATGGEYMRWDHVRLSRARDLKSNVHVLTSHIPWVVVSLLIYSSTVRLCDDVRFIKIYGAVRGGRRCS